MADTTTDELPRILKVHALRKIPFSLAITWNHARPDSRVNMTGVVASLEAFAPLRDPVLFRQVSVIDHGLGIGWPNGLDYAAGNLRVLADEQHAMDGRAFGRWQKRLNLSNQEAADALGVSLRTVKNYRLSREVPTAVRLACRAMARDPLVLQAHYRPRRVGRPPKGENLGNEPRPIKITNAPNKPNTHVGDMLRPTMNLHRDHQSGRLAGDQPKAPRRRKKA